MKLRRGFTLVELLVVIAIIGILVGLLLPAIGTIRERARNMTCSNNVRQLALAALQYETAKGYLPGYVQKFGVFPGGVDPTDPGNYAGAVPRHVKVGGYGVALLAFLDAQGTHEHWIEDRYPVISNGTGEYRGSSRLSGTGFHALSAPNIPVFQCPSNPNKDGSHGLNSYCPNNGMSHLRTGAGQIANFAVAESRNNGIFNAKYVGLGASPALYCGAQVGPKVTLDDIKDGKANTMLFGESAQAIPWHRPGFLNGGSLTTLVGAAAEDIASSQNLLAAKFTSGMVWHYEDRDAGAMPALPANSACGISATACNPVRREHKINSGGKAGKNSIFTLQMTPANAVDLARPSSAHVDGFNAGFADGATRFVNSSIDYRAYQALLTTRGKSSNVPFAEFVLTDEIAQ